ncbi:monocarboxylate transporter 4-like [Cylas formicarius]|uniref:monocarboxylate transporter 4-like n=1 Tax=Cylas formicarius TaxID=197179 RepID=UPI0029587414|nr:monocarboxylate transporter 4-like [Cylas formicarius]
MSGTPKYSGRPSLSHASRSILINLDDIEQLVTIPPDGGWGWVVALSAFLVNFILDGTIYCFGIFLDDISKELKVKPTDVAVANSVLSGFYYLGGPFACAAINRFGFRTVGFVGGILATISFLWASFLTKILPFVLTIGILGGSGFNLIYAPSAIVVGFYFERWRALAMALTLCGTSLGVIIYPPLMITLFRNYNWRIKFRIIASFCACCGLLILTYRPIKPTKIGPAVQFNDFSRGISAATLQRDSEANAGFATIFQRLRNTIFPTISEIPRSHYTSFDSAGSRSSDISRFIMQRRDTDTADIQSTFIKCDSDECLPASEADQQIFGAGVKTRLNKCWQRLAFLDCCKSSSESSININRPMYRDDIFYAGSVYALPQYPKDSQPVDLLNPSLMYTLSVTRAATQRDLWQERQCLLCPEAFLRTLATMLNFQMLKSPPFLIVVLSGFLSLQGMYIPFIYIAERGAELQIEKSKCYMLLSVIGISNIIGRISCGTVSFFPKWDVNCITYVGLIICGTVTILSSFMKTFSEQIIFCIVFGYTIATFSVLRTILFVEFFGLENLTNAFGLNMFFQAVASFSGVPISNVLYKITGTFVASFTFSGGVILLSGLLLIPIRRLLKREQNTRN